MIVASAIRDKINSFQAGYVFTMSDFAMDPSNEMALAKLLSRMAAVGEIYECRKGSIINQRKRSLE